MGDLVWGDLQMRNEKKWRAVWGCQEEARRRAAEEALARTQAAARSCSASGSSRAKSSRSGSRARSLHSTSRAWRPTEIRRFPCYQSLSLAGQMSLEEKLGVASSPARPMRKSSSAAEKEVFDMAGTSTLS
eukprot:CAMPEP_0170609644 /NCGR_PEP_ID=MMETSP0224-20130122/22235_1 /TAXON_ID=285029 /ORGANISM="Togula jolla, Strain CCCM 725" /LENGTH=130 /DNA_ID=CAMNT_0010934965 /DNA_START=114 /DNA_END=504 /DNA_ORIENTATION=-